MMSTPKRPSGILAALVVLSTLVFCPPILAATVTLTGLDAVKEAFRNKAYDVAEYGCYVTLWGNIRQPEVLAYLGSAIDKQNRAEEAAAAYTLFLRTLDAKAPAEVLKLKPEAEKRLAELKLDQSTLAAAYAKTSAGRRFEVPDKVDDIWMLNAEADLFGLHDLYARKLVRGRKDAKPDWIHNTHGTLHRSGMKHVTEVDGRKGVLFGIPLKASGAQEKLGHPSQLLITNVAGAKILRVGIKGYGFDFDLHVRAGDQEIFTQKIAMKQWSDLKIDLPSAAPGQRITLQFIVPEDQKWAEGLWLDYADFFDN